MSFFSDIGGFFRGLYNRLPLSDVPQPKKRRLAADVPKIGFMGPTRERMLDEWLAVPDYREYAGRRWAGPREPEPEEPSYPAAAVAPIESRETLATVDPLSRYTDMPIERINGRLQDAHSYFWATYGFEPPRSTPLAIATNPGIPDGAIKGLFSTSPAVAEKIRALAQAAGRAAGGAIELVGRPYMEQWQAGDWGTSGETVSRFGQIPTPLASRESYEFEPTARQKELREPEALLSRFVQIGADVLGGKALAGAGRLAASSSPFWSAVGKSAIGAAKGATIGVTAASLYDLVDQYERGELGAEDAFQIAVTAAGALMTGKVAKDTVEQALGRLSPAMRRRVFGVLAEETGAIKPPTGKEPKPVGSAVPPGGSTGQYGGKEAFVRRVAARIQERAIETGIDLGELPTHVRIPLKEQAHRVSQLFPGGIERPEQVIRIALAQEAAPEGVLPNIVHIAVEQWALEHKDGALVRQLANSPITGDLSLAGTVIRAERERMPTSPVRIIRDVKVKIGKDVTTEQAQTITDLTNAMTEAQAAIETGGNPLEFGAAKVALRNYVADLKNPRRKMGLVETIRDVKLKELHPWNAVKSIAGFAKQIKTTFDDSFVGRQGQTLRAHNPRKWVELTLKSFDDIVKTIGGREVLDGIDADGFSRPNARNGIYDKMRVAMGVTEEEITAPILEKIPGIGRLVKAADVAFTAFARRARFEVADEVVAVKQATDGELTDEWLKGAGRYVNSLTARGHLGKLEPVADTLNLMMFSPRNLKARFDFLSAHVFDSTVPRDIKKMAAMDLLKYVVGSAAILTTAEALGANVENDPTSADYGTIRVGSTRFDVTGGLKSIVALATRLTKGSYKSSTTGKITEYGPELGQISRFDAVVDFLSNKAAPGPGLVANLLRGEDFKHELLTGGGTVSDLFMPMVIESAREAKATPDSANALLVLIADGLGFSASSYLAPDNPLIKTEKIWAKDTAKFTSKEKFMARFQWRDRIRPELERLAGQEDKRAATGWRSFIKLWEARNIQLKGDPKKGQKPISPQSKYFRKDVWDRALSDLRRRYPVFGEQYRRLPESLILR